MPSPPSSAPMRAPISGKRARDCSVSVGDMATCGTGMTVRKPMLPAIGPHLGVRGLVTPLRDREPRLSRDPLPPPNGSILDPFLGLDPSVIGMLDRAHLRDQVGEVDQLLCGIPPGDNHVLVRGTLPEDRKDLL